MGKLVKHNFVLLADPQLVEKLIEDILSYHELNSDYGEKVANKFIKGRHPSFEFYEFITWSGLWQYYPLKDNACFFAYLMEQASDIENAYNDLPPDNSFSGIRAQRYLNNLKRVEKKAEEYFALVPHLRLTLFVNPLSKYILGVDAKKEFGTKYLPIPPFEYRSINDTIESFKYPERLQLT